MLHGPLPVVESGFLLLDLFSIFLNSLGIAGAQPLHFRLNLRILLRFVRLEFLQLLTPAGFVRVQGLPPARGVAEQIVQ